MTGGTPTQAVLTRTGMRALHVHFTTEDEIETITFGEWDINDFTATSEYGSGARKTYSITTDIRNVSLSVYLS